MYTKKIIATIFTFFIYFCTLAQFAKVKNYGIQDGLPNNYVYQIGQDSLGYIWLGTGDGLLRLDETNFEKKSFLKDSKESMVVTSFLNFNESIWFSDNNGNIFEHIFGKISYYGQPMKQRIISTLALDESHILFVTPDQGATIYDTKKRKFKNITLTPSRINSCYIHKNQLYVCSSKGIKIFDLRNVIPEHLKTLLASENVTSLDFLKNDDFYFGTESQGVFLYNQKNSTFLPFGVQLKKIKSPVKNILIDSNGNVWIATFGEGVICFTNKQNGKFLGVKIFLDQFEKDFKYSTQIFEDYEKNIWVSTYGNGINLLYNNYIHPFSNYRSKDGRVNSIISTKDKLFLSVENLILSINENQKSDTIYSLPSNLCVSSLASDGTELYIGTEANGVYSLNLRTRKLIKIEYDAHEISNKINQILLVENSLWIASYDGLFEHQLQTKFTKKYSTQNGLRHNLIYTIASLPDKTIIVGTKSNRLFLIKDGIIKEKTLPTDNMIITINSIHVLSENKIAIGTLGNGLFIYDHGYFENFTVKNGLVSNYVFGINTIDENHLLVFSETEFSILNLLNSKIETISGKSAISSNFTPNADSRFLKTSIYFGTNEKLYVFDGKKYLEEKFNPKLAFTLLKINDSIYNLAQVKDKISLPAGSYKIELDFKGVNFLHGTDLEYFYKLEGFDESWHQSKESLALYKQLKSGRYRFAIKVCHNGECQEKTAHFILEINKPFWQSLWFIISCLLTVFWAIIVLFLLQERNNRRNKKILEYSIQLKNQELLLKENDHSESLEFVTLVEKASKVRQSHFQNKDIDNFLIQKQKETLSSDFYWFEKKDNTIIVVLYDHQKKGISAGAFNIWLINVLNNAVKNHNIQDPKILRKHLFDSIKNNFGENHVNLKLKLSIAQINTEKQELQICSINQKSIIIEQNKESHILQDNYNFDSDESIINDFTFDLKKINSIYLLSDGLEVSSNIRDEEFFNLLLQVQDKEFFVEKDILQGFLNKLEDKSKKWDNDFTCIGFRLKR